MNTVTELSTQKENEISINFCIPLGRRCAQSEDHFDCSVKMWTKATIIDFFASAAWV